MTGRIDAHFYKPQFRNLLSRLRESGANRLADIVAFSDETWDQKDGRFGAEVPYIEISAVGLGNNEYEVAQVHLAEIASRARLVVRDDDIIVSLTRPNRGAIAAIRSEDNGTIASTGFAVLRDILDVGYSKHYLLLALLSRFSLDQMSMRASGGNYPAITNEELGNILLPSPSQEQQNSIVIAMDTARTTRRAKLAEAEALLAGLDGFLMDTLGLMLPEANARKVFAVPFAEVLNRRFDPPAFQPLYAKGHQPKTPLSDLQELAFIDTHTVAKPLDDNTLVPYVGLPECDQTEVREVAMRPYREVKGRSVVKEGDILFARIEPSVFNQKYVLVDDLKGHSYAYTSTEFYVVTPRPEITVIDYLYAMFFCSFVFAQTKGKTTGSSGRRRLDANLFRTLQIPAPELSVQEQIAGEARRRREESRRLRAEAEAGWQAAKQAFEAQLLGTK